MENGLHSLHVRSCPSTDDREESDDTTILHELENIDDDLDQQGIHIVKIADDVAEKEFGIEDTPCLVYFEKEVRRWPLFIKMCGLPSLVLVFVTSTIRPCQFGNAQYCQRQL